MSDSDSELEQSQSSSAVPRADSKLYNSIDTYGSNSYYYAHNREFVIPDDAKVTEGPGIITGGAPVKLGESAPLLPSVVRRKIEKYSWCDDGGKVRIYIEDPQILPFIAESTENVTCSFDCQSFSVEVRSTDREIYAFTVPDLSEEITCEGSSWKVSLGKRITVSLNKKSPDTKWSNLKKSSR
jgi:hypothetical protein